MITHRILRSSQVGISLLEILISLALGVFMLAGILSLMASVSSTRSELSKTSAQIENGRYAIQLLSDEISLAGFFGRYSPPLGGTRTLPGPCEDSVANLGFSSAGPTFPVAVQGFPIGGTVPGTCLPSAAEDAGGNTTTEVLVVHRVDVEPYDLETNAAGGTIPYLQISSCSSDTNEIVFSKTNADLILQDKECDDDAEGWPYITRMFFITPCEVCDGSDSRPTLKVVEYVNGVLSNAIPLVSDVEDMHFEYGLDLVNADGVPDCYADDPSVDSPTAAEIAAGCDSSAWSTVDEENWNNVVAIQVYVLVRGETPSLSSNSVETYDIGRPARVGPFNDRYRRQVFSALLSIPNVAGPRE